MGIIGDFFLESSSKLMQEADRKQKKLRHNYPSLDQTVQTVEDVLEDAAMPYEQRDSTYDR